MIDVLQEKYNEIIETIPPGQRLPFIMEFHPGHLIQVNDWSLREIHHFINDMEQYRC